MTKQELLKLKKKLGCLIPKPGACAPSCHEFSTCDCTVLDLIERLEGMQKCLEEIKSWCTSPDEDGHCHIAECEWVRRALKKYGVK